MQKTPEFSPEHLKQPEAPQARINTLSRGLRILEAIPETAETEPKVSISRPSVTNEFENRRQQSIELDEQLIRHQITGIYKDAA
jgi:hypothetical protein